MAEVAIIGGSGLYSILEGATEEEVDTKYGRPSGPIAVGKVGGIEVAFLNRHGKAHTLPPHKVPYIANIEALASLGVKWIITSNAVGSLDIGYKPGDMVLFDQFVNMTHGRRDTFFDGPEVVHTSVSDPYCSTLSDIAARKADELGYNCHKRGTVVVVNGPRFSSKAESAMFIRQGFQTINMTAYPEVVLAREKKIHFLGVGLVTDYDNGVHLPHEAEPVTFDEVKRIFDMNVEKVKRLILETIPEIKAQTLSCVCEK